MLASEMYHWGTFWVKFHIQFSQDSPNLLSLLHFSSYWVAVTCNTCKTLCQHITLSTWGWCQKRDWAQMVLFNVCAKDFGLVVTYSPLKPCIFCPSLGKIRSPFFCWAIINVVPFNSLWWWPVLACTLAAPVTLAQLARDWYYVEFSFD